MFMTGVLCTVCGAQVYFSLFSVANSSANTIQLKSSMTFIQSNGCTERDLILIIWRPFIGRQVSFMFCWGQVPLWISLFCSTYRFCCVFVINAEELKQKSLVNVMMPMRIKSWSIIQIWKCTLITCRRKWQWGQQKGKKQLNLKI